MRAFKSHDFCKHSDNLRVAHVDMTPFLVSAIVAIPLTEISTIALGVISALGVAGVVPVAAVGSLLITVGSLHLFRSFCVYNIKDTSILPYVFAIVGLALIILGAIGVSSTLSGAVLGYIGIASSALFVAGEVLIYKKWPC